VPVLLSQIVAGALLAVFGLVMLLLPDRDTPYGVRRRTFGVMFSVLGPFVVVLGLFGIPFGRG
jgi:hypothetical protein